MSAAAGFRRQHRRLRGVAISAAPADGVIVGSALINAVDAAQFINPAAAAFVRPCARHWR